MERKKRKYKRKAQIELGVRLCLMIFSVKKRREREEKDEGVRREDESKELINESDDVEIEEVEKKTFKKRDRENFDEGKVGGEERGEEEELEEEKKRGGIPKVVKIVLGIFIGFMVLMVGSMLMIKFMGKSKPKTASIVMDVANQQNQQFQNQGLNQGFNNQSMFGQVNQTGEVQVNQMQNQVQTQNQEQQVSGGINQNQAGQGQKHFVSDQKVSMKDEGKREQMVGERKEMQKEVQQVYSQRRDSGGERKVFEERVKKEDVIFDGERDIFKEFYVMKKKDEKGAERKKDVKKEKGSSLLEQPLPLQPAIQPPVMQPLISQDPLTTCPGGKNFNKQEVESSLILYGIVCNRGRCEAITNKGIFKEGDPISQEEKVVRVEKDRLVTNFRTLIQ